ncbi:hypothetical protein N566_24400 [Streptomycetaceae bacterium MP113-05]|nr:hypothetical protein N566_24400 [Streptomycetaceae bacterium MP113-05]
MPSGPGSVTGAVGGSGVTEDVRAADPGVDSTNGILLTDACPDLGAGPP